MNLYDDYIDVRDVIKRFEELGSERADLDTELDDARNSVEIATPKTDEETEAHARLHHAAREIEVWDEANAEELTTLDEVLGDIKGYGGDYQWRGDWYPVTLIRDSAFIGYAEELASDTGAIDRDANWPLSHIDWEAAASELQTGFNPVDVDGTTYWYR